jgi:hypothetical protein
MSWLCSGSRRRQLGHVTSWWMQDLNKIPSSGQRVFCSNRVGCRSKRLSFKITWPFKGTKQYCLASNWSPQTTSPHISATYWERCVKSESSLQWKVVQKWESIDFVSSSPGNTLSHSEEAGTKRQLLWVWGFWVGGGQKLKLKFILI